jgi:hypothetical protein
MYSQRLAAGIAKRVSKPRVAATLGTKVNNRFNRNAVASNWPNPFRVDKDLHLLPQG